MNKRRLKSLIRVLNKVPIKKFDMNFWSREDYCGTTACAAGHFVKSPAGRRIGFKVTGLSFILKHWFGYTALQKAFDINENESFFIFDDLSYPNPDKIKPAHVIKHVKQVMEGRQ